jgi:hypothetical protein
VRKGALTWLVAACALAGACSGPKPPREAGTAVPYGEDEFAARAAALLKACELAAVYLGTDDARAAAVVEQARAEAREAVRRAPDAHRGAAFARALERLDGSAAALAGAGDYAPPLTGAACDRLRAELLSTADELRPLGEPYYLKMARRYEGVGRRRVTWGPLPPPEPARAERRPAAALPPAEAAPEVTPPADEPPPPTETTPSGD